MSYINSIDVSDFEGKEEDHIRASTMVSIDLQDVDLNNEDSQSAADRNEEVRRPGINIKCTNAGVPKVIYMILFIPRLFSLVVATGYDIKCAVLESASVVNCTQEFFVPRPECWVLFWFVNSNCSSVILIVILWCDRKRLNYSFKQALKRLCKKASFWSMNALFVITLVYYILRIHEADELTMALSVMLLFWWPATLLVVVFLNYLPPIWWPSPNESNERDAYEVGFCLMYWLSLILYSAETFCFVIASTLDAALNLTPLIDGKYRGNQVEALALIFLLIRVAFVTRLFSFFFYKIFHGNKDLFSEPSEKLEKRSEEMEL